MKERETSQEAESSLEFGRVLEKSSTDRKVWFLIVPLIVGLGAVLVFAGLAIARTSELESRLRLAEQQAQEAQKAVEQRDELIKKARADEDVLRSAGQGVSVMAAAQAGSPATGVAVVHPEKNAAKLYVFGLEQPEPGSEYRIEAVTADRERARLGRIAPDARGTGFVLSRELPEDATRIEIVLAKVAAGEGSQSGEPGEGAEAERGGGEPATGDATLVLAGVLPKPGTAGVVAAPDLSGQVQARTPSGRSRRTPR